MNKVILASQNRDKIREIDAILAKFGMTAVPRDDAGLPTFEIEEDGETFEENSRLKAKTILDLSGLPTIADDTGLMVDALGGEPGVYSARWAGEDCTYLDNNLKLLASLQGVPAERRTAKFVTVITMLFPDGTGLSARGECPGRIAEEMRGETGFGYDPLFIPEGYDCTFAEMGQEVKNRISHRARALEKLEDLIRERKF